VYRLRLSAHDLAVALDIETDLVAPVPRSAFDSRQDALQRYVADRLVVTAQAMPCVLAPLVLDASLSMDDVLLVLHYRCPAPVVRLGINYGLFFDLDPAHRSLGRIHAAGAEEPFVLDRSLTRVTFEVGAPTGFSATRFLRVLGLGVEHIVGGWDHLVFLLALLLGSTSLGAIIKVVTAFTAAHSLTLALAWYGVVALPSRLVEVAIAGTIAWVAVENVAGWGAGHRGLLAGGFGLVHGLGFYGALRDLGLTGADVVTTLVAFNLGVEVGQVTLVALAWRPLRWWARQPWYRQSMRAGSVAILVVAVWWVIQRALFG
jgi:hypothetical protein